MKRLTPSKNIALSETWDDKASNNLNTLASLSSMKHSRINKSQRVRSIPLLLVALLGPTSMREAAQDMNSLKAGVVRISNTKSGEIGTGFIVRIVKDRMYVVTSSHVVHGNGDPDLYLYNRQQDPIRATVRDIEEDGLKGLALLTLKANEATFSSLREFTFKDSSQLSGGEDVRIIGFPDSTEIWTVSSATVARLDGRNLVFSGIIHRGNSGAPVLLNGQVVGLVTDINRDQELTYAARSESIVAYVNGIVKELNVGLASQSSPEVPKDEFCETLGKLVEASKGGFYSIVGTPTKSENTFVPNLMMPGAVGGYVIPQKQVYYYLLIDGEKGRVESQFYVAVSRVSRCLSKWEQNEDTDSTYRYHKFKESKGTTVVEVYYNPAAQNGKHYLTLEIVSAPDSNPTTKLTFAGPSIYVLAALQNTIWLEHGVTIKGEPVYLEFEPDGRVRTRTSSDTKGYVAVNVAWHASGNTLYVQVFDYETKRLLIERNGTVKSDRIEGTYKNLTTGSTTQWLLTRVTEIAR
jgi:S1-C subfamily serine protease